ncbi:MAG: TatD family hydrolase [Nitrospiria bacterium]
MLIDTHTHLHDPEFDADLAAVIERARQTGIGRMITIGTDLESSRKAVQLAERYDLIYATVGVHPHEVKTLREESYDSLEHLVRSASGGKVVGYGEVGLDYYYMHSPKELQQKHFRGQIRLARKLRLPLIIHTRQAPEETLAILKEVKADEVGGVFHCYTGDLATAQAAIAMNFFISFSGILTFPKATDLQTVAREIPMEHLLIETDCPYLAPVPHRGKRNEPAYVCHVAEKLALIKGLPCEEIIDLTTKNARRLFNKMA